MTQPTSAPPALGPALWSVVAARLISSTGAEAAFFLGLWGKAVFVFDGTPADLAILSALVSVAAVVGSLTGGVAVDRFDARRVVLAAEAVFVPATLLLVLADNMTALLALGTVSWLAGSVLETAITSLPPVIAPPDRLEQANARLESANWAALIIGPAIGAPLVSQLGMDSVFVLDAATSVVALVLIGRLRLPAPTGRPAASAPVDAPLDGPLDAPVDRGGTVSQTVDGLRYSLSSPPIRTALYLGTLVGVGFGIFVALEPLFFRDVVGVGVEAIGYVNAVFGVGLLIGSLALDRLSSRLTGFRALVWLTILSGLGGIIYVSTSSLVTVLIGALAWSVPLGASLPLMRTMAQRSASPAYTGRVMGAVGVVTESVTILPLIVAPALAAVLGVQGVLMAAAAVALVGAPLVLGAARRLDAAHRAAPTPGELTREPAPEPEPAR